MPAEQTPASVVLVEDSPDDVELVQRAFARHGFANPLRVFPNGNKLLEWLADPALPEDSVPDIILLDLRLPGPSGLDILRTIRHDPRRGDLVVFILTSANAFDDIDAAYAAGANAVLFKPIDFGQFVERVAEVGLHWQLVGTATPVGAPA